MARRWQLRRRRREAPPFFGPSIQNSRPCLPLARPPIPAINGPDVIDLTRACALSVERALALVHSSYSFQQPSGGHPVLARADRTLWLSPRQPRPLGAITSDGARPGRHAVSAVRPWRPTRRTVGCS
jgi:hypothetical protein